MGGFDNNLLTGEQGPASQAPNNALSGETFGQLLPQAIQNPAGTATETGYTYNYPNEQQPTQQTAGTMPWRATYGQVAPGFYNGAGGGGTPQSNTPWRAGYNQVAPGYYNGQGEAPPQTTTTNPGYNPGYNGGYNPENPNANGNQPTGPVWHPNQQYSWNTPSPTVPGQQPGDASTGTPAQPGNSGIPGYSQGNNFFDPNRADINAALVRSVNFPFQMMIGGISGAAFGGPIPWILNKTADSILVSAGKQAAETPRVLFPEGSWMRKIFPDSTLNKVENAASAVSSAKGAVTPGQDSAIVKGAQWWQDHFDPQHFGNADLVMQQGIKSTVQSSLAKIAEQNQAEISGLMAKYPQVDQMPEEAASELQRLSARQDVLTSTNWQTPTLSKEFMQNVKATQEANPGTFSPEEMKLFNDRAQAVNQTADIMKSREQSGSFTGDGLLKNFVAGAAFVGVTMVADNYLDRLFGNNHQQGFTDSSATSGIPIVGGLTHSWNTNSLLLPLAFTAGDGWGPKAIAERAALTGAALIGGKVLDKVLPTSSAQKFSQLLQPTGVDSLLMGAAFLLPAASKPQRLAMIAGAWALGRVYNMFEGPAPIDTKNQAFQDMQTDLKDRSAGSMNKAIDEFKKLGALDDQSLKLYAADWLRPGRTYQDYMSAYRGAVILCSAFGESRLQHGTLIPQTQDSFILGGSNLDVDSQALRALMIAQVNVKNAIAQTQKENGQNEDGSNVNASSETQALNQIGQQIQQQINTIYGQHDINKAVDELQNDYKGNQAGITRLKMDIQNTVAVNRNSTDKEFMAKQFRDMALIDLSVAELKMKSGDKQGAYQMLYGDTYQGRNAALNNGQAQGYDGALDEINLAAQYSPNNPDLPQLQAIANQLKSELPQQIQQQMANPTYNPNNVNGWLSQPAAPGFVKR